MSKAEYDDDDYDDEPDTTHPVHNPNGKIRTDVERKKADKQRTLEWKRRRKEKMGDE